MADIKEFEEFKVGKKAKVSIADTQPSSFEATAFASKDFSITEYSRVKSDQSIVSEFEIKNDKEVYTFNFKIDSNPSDSLSFTFGDSDEFSKEIECDSSESPSRVHVETFDDVKVAVSSTCSDEK